MTLTYWVAECENDSDAYNIREATKKAVLERLAEYGCAWQPLRGDGGLWVSGDGPYENRFRAPHKVIVEYDSGLDLLKQCLGEGGIYEGADQD